MTLYAGERLHTDIPPDTTQHVVEGKEDQHGTYCFETHRTTITIVLRCMLHSRKPLRPWMRRTKREMSSNSGSLELHCERGEAGPPDL